MLATFVGTEGNPAKSDIMYLHVEQYLAKEACTFSQTNNAVSHSLKFLSWLGFPTYYHIPP